MDHVDINFKELSAIVGLLIAFAGTVGVWIDQRSKTRQLEKRADSMETAHNVCFGQQSDRWDTINSLINTVKSDMIRYETKLDTIIEVLRNGAGGKK